MSELERTEAIVMRTIRYRESDSVVHLLTLAEGRRNAMARRARAIRSGAGGRLEPCTVVELILASGKGELANVRDARLVRDHPGLRGDYHAQQSAATAFSAINRLLLERQPNEPVYHLSCRMLDLLDAHPGTDGAPVRDAVVVAFTLKLMFAIGLAPELGVCVRCGSVDELEEAGFVPADGGVVCARCRQPGEWGMDPVTVTLARAMLTRSLRTVAEAVTTGAVDRAAALAVNERLLSPLCEEHAGFRPKMASG